MRNWKNRIVLFVVAAVAVLSLHAQKYPSKELFKANPLIAASNYMQYPGPKGQLTPAPKGYEPYYLSHYGRHGSRYHIGAVYTETYSALMSADSLGMLTPRGKQLLKEVDELRHEAAGRDGELTELGAQQHHEIAGRMYDNFPEIFAKPTTIDAKSTVVIRCILSMENALQELVARNPKLSVKHDASYHDMYYMNRSDDVIYAEKEKGYKLVGKLWDSHLHPDRVMNIIFNNESYWRDSIKANRFYRNIIKLAMNVQSSEIRHRLNLLPLFTTDELYEYWEVRNAEWYVTYGPSSLTKGMQPYSQRVLLNKMISEADSCLVLGNPGATLRFGHDTMVMPLVCLLEIDGKGKDVADLFALDENGWRDYEIFPMACNVQLVFYRSKGATGKTADKDSAGKDILVKVLHNENEGHLPIKTDMWPYYRWSDVKAYFTKKIADYDATH